MQEDVLIKKYFYNLNYIVLCEMYLNEYLKPDVIEEKDLKKYNPGHLGTSLSLNFIQANLNYFLNKNKLTSVNLIQNMRISIIKINIIIIKFFIS